MRGRVYIGTSGWNYKHWKGEFYPAELPAKRWLHFYIQHFPVVEVNYSFYRFPSSESLVRWRKETPPEFRFVLKANRVITHRKRLLNVENALQSFIEAATLLEEKLAAILYQLPPSLKLDCQRLSDFLALLPPSINHAIEFRHDSWITGEVFDILRHFAVAYCVVSAPALQCHIEATARFVYIRMHGITSWYSYQYTEGDLRWWHRSITPFLKEGKDVYIFFNNDACAYAAKNGMRLMEMFQNQ